MGGWRRTLTGRGFWRNPSDRRTRNDREPERRPAFRPILTLCAGFLISLSITAKAQSTRYTYDDLGRLHQVIDAQGNVATYTYDAVGNILSIERGEGDCPVGPPTVGNVTATAPCLVGASCEVTIDGASLLGGGVTAGSAEAAVSMCHGTCNQITCRLTLTPFVAVGALPLTVTTGFGFSLGTVQVDYGDVNLLQNADAESGNGSPSGTDVLPIPSWVTTSKFTVSKYGTNSHPSLAVSQANGGGLQFFTGGPSNPLSTAVQTVDVAPAAPAIDAGSATATLSAYLGVAVPRRFRNRYRHLSR